jgi:protein TonB
MNPGTYTVQVKFLVERDGTITDVQALNDPGFGLKKAAEDVVKKGPKWSPGVQNGKQVRSYHTQPITFMIQDQ